MQTYHDSTDLSTLMGQTIPSEYLYQEQERELMEAAAADFDGYDEWSIELEGNPENFIIRDGRILHKPEPPKRERCGAIEI